MEFLASATWVLIGALTAYFAKQRGRNALGWFLLGLFFGIFALLALFLLPKGLEKQSESVIPAESKWEDKPAFDTVKEPAEWYYSDKDYQRQGPIAYHELLALWNTHQLTDESLVWREGLSDWKKISEEFSKS